MKATAACGPRRSRPADTAADSDRSRPQKALLPPVIRAGAGPFVVCSAAYRSRCRSGLQRRVQGDLDAGKGRRNGAARLGLAGDPLEFLFGDARGPSRDSGQVAAGDAGARLEGDVRLGVDFLGGVKPAWASAWLNAIEKQRECAAAISSSGLVLPSAASVRAFQVTSNVPRPELSSVVLTGPRHQVAVPYCVCGACCCHVHSSTSIRSGAGCCRPRRFPS